MSYHTRGATLLVFQICLLYSLVMQAERPLFHWLSAAWEPPTRPTCFCCPPESFLRTATHECVLRVHLHSELPLYIGSLLAATLILFRSTRVSLLTGSVSKRRDHVEGIIPFGLQFCRFICFPIVIYNEETEQSVLPYRTQEDCRHALCDADLRG